MLNIRFIGICCHVDPRDANDPFRKRVVLVNGTQGHDAGHGNGNGNGKANGNGNGNGHRGMRGNGHGASHVSNMVSSAADHIHIPYVAFEKDDVLSTSTGETGHEYTPGGNTKYVRFELNREEIIIDPLRPDPFNQLDTFADLVPSMTKIAPQAPPAPREECFDPTRDPHSIVAGYIDINCGWLMAGDRELNKTVFDRPSRWPVQRNAISTNLLVNWSNEDHPVVTLRSIDTGQERRINLRPKTLSMTIGNQPLHAIEFPNDEGFSIAPSEHYGLYYNLLPDTNQPIQQPLPSLDAPLTNGCIVQNWP